MLETLLKAIYLQYDLEKNKSQSAKEKFTEVTRLSCGSFILAHETNHTLLDGAGMGQFPNAVADLARSASCLSVTPVWVRERLMARDPPRVMHDHHEYDDLEVETDAATVVIKSFFFGAGEFDALWQQLLRHIRAKTTRFEMLTACVWRCQVAALDCDDGEEVRAMITINMRHKCIPPLPLGFYGNGYVYPVAQAMAGELRQCSLGYAVELVKAVKESVCAGYLQSVADLIVLQGRPKITMARTYMISDLRSLRFDEPNFGWGESVYTGPAVSGGKVVPPGGTCYIKYRNSKGEDGILVPVKLPAPEMERFEVEIQQMVKEEIRSYEAFYLILCFVSLMHSVFVSELGIAE